MELLESYKTLLSENRAAKKLVSREYKAKLKELKQVQLKLQAAEVSILILQLALEMSMKHIPSLQPVSCLVSVCVQDNTCMDGFNLRQVLRI